MIKKKWVYLLFAFAVMLFCYTQFYIPASHRGKVHITSKIVPVNNGWGYEIYADSQLYIKQYHIPALAQYKPFVSQRQAEQVANLVIYKITHTKIPTIQLSELDSLGIH